jgi:FkbM family methyltransferase
LKQYGQAFLRRIGLYQRLKSSFVYDLYWAFANQRLLEARANEVEFYKKTLRGFQRGSLVFDIGANEGYKTDIFLRLGARVVAVDPDPTSQDVLRQKFLKYRFVPKKVAIEGRAASDAITTKTLWIDTPGSAKNTLSQKWVSTLRYDEHRFRQRFHFGDKIAVETTTLEKLIQVHGYPFFIKIDVEGYEPNVLQGLKQPVPYLSFEVNLPEFRAEGLRCIDILGGIVGSGEFNYAVDCQRGMVCERWMTAKEFAQVLGQCSDPSIEVFWKTCIGAEPA